MMRWLGSALAAVVCGVAVGGAQAQTRFPEIPEASLIQNCGSRQASPDICRLRADVPSAAERLGEATTAIWREGERLVIVTRNPAEAVFVRGGLSAPMARIEGTDLWTLVLRSPHLDAAMVDVFVDPPVGELESAVWIGPQAEPAPVFQADLQGRIVWETVDSRHLGGARGLTLYLPPGFDPARRYPVAYMADGDGVAAYARLVEPAIQAGRVRPLVLVGLHDGPGEQRSIDYLVGWRADGFERHEAFLLEEVMPLAEGRYGASAERDERLLLGKSSGGAWALDTALRHPDLFGAAAPMALGYEGPRSAAGVGRPGRPRLFMATGLFDPFIRRSREVAALAATSGDEVRFLTPVSGHGDLFFQVLLDDVLAWAFGPGGE